MASSSNNEAGDRDLQQLIPGAPIVRHARREDVPTILDLIHALADYEHASEEVEATESSLLSTLSFAPSSSSTTSSSTGHSSTNDNSTNPSNTPNSSTEQGQGQQGYARTLLIFTPEPEVKAAGMALYFYSYSTWRAAPGIYVEDLFVKPEYRGRGYGTRLLAELAAEVARLRGGRLEWSVLKWNEPSIKFYQGIGAKALDEWMTMRVDGAALVELAKNGKGLDH